MTLSAALALVLAGCSSGEKAAAGGDGAVAVKVYTVEEQVVNRAVQATGSLFALEESVISAEVEGRVERVAADVGDMVKQGQELVLISPVELRLEAERQRAAVQQVRARLGIGPAEPLPRSPDQVAFVQRAAADLSDAEQKHRRAEELHRNQLISQQEFDASAARYKGARAAYDESVQQVDQLKAQLQSSEAARSLAEKKLNDATIRAPIPGAVKERRISPGEFVRVQSPVMVIVRTDQLRARLAVPEKWAGSLRVGAPVEVRVEAYPSEVFRGRVERINPSVSAETRTFEVEAILQNGDGRLKPGFFAQATMPSELQEKSLTLPEEAVSYRYGVYKVFFVEGNQVDEREVKTGAQAAGRIEILAGAKAGERVAVAQPGGALRDGAAIKQ
jgi:multidrug efflux pump subunit AcrA (membrane-fusion protein)